MVRVEYRKRSSTRLCEFPWGQGSSMYLTRSIFADQYYNLGRKSYRRSTTKLQSRKTTVGRGLLWCQRHHKTFNDLKASMCVCFAVWVLRLASCSWISATPETFAATYKRKLSWATIAVTARRAICASSTTRIGRRNRLKSSTSLVQLTVPSVCQKISNRLLSWIVFPWDSSAADVGWKAEKTVINYNPKFSKNNIWVISFYQRAVERGRNCGDI